MFRLLADLARRGRGAVLAAAIVLTVVAAATAAGVQQHLSSTLSDYGSTTGPSTAARQEIERRTGIDVQQGYIVLVRTDQPVTATGPVPAAVTETVALLQRQPHVKRVLDYRTAGDPNMIARGGHETYVVAQLSKVVEATVTPELQRVFASDPQLRGHVTLGGPTVATQQISAISTEDLSKAESIALPILFILLFFVFRGVVAALLPLAGGIFAILLSLLTIRVITTFTELSVFALNLVIALGLGLAIDYSLLMVSRYREELAGGSDSPEALRRTLHSAGRTVLFSALTVSAALAVLCVFPIPFVWSMGLAGIVVVLSSAVYGLVVLPSLLLVLGPRINALAPRRWQLRLEGGSGSGAWAGWARQVMRRPILFALAGAAILLLCGSPAVRAQFTGIDVTALPSTASAAMVNAAMEHDFPGGSSTPYDAVVHAPAGDAARVAAYARRVDGVSGVSVTAPPRFLGDSLWEIQGSTRGEALSTSSLNSISDVRALSAPFSVQVTGASADFLDQEHAIVDHLPLAVALAVVTTLVFLFALTGSLVLPVKALIMNALTLSAALGLLVWTFQQGHGSSLLGFTSMGALDTSSPLVMVAVTFGLSTDYGVFLLGRITEEHLAGAETRTAVSTGLEHTGRIVTSAAILLCVATGALAISRLIMIKELGVGITFGVLVDASIVRAMLVPALMAILGPINWWAPEPLRALPPAASRPSARGAGRSAAARRRLITPRPGAERPGDRLSYRQRLVTAGGEQERRTRGWRGRRMWWWSAAGSWACSPRGSCAGRGCR